MYGFRHGTSNERPSRGSVKRYTYIGGDIKMERLLCRAFHSFAGAFYSVNTIRRVRKKVGINNKYLCSDITRQGQTKICLPRTKTIIITYECFYLYLYYYYDNALSGTHRVAYISTSFHRPAVCCRRRIKGRIIIRRTTVVNGIFFFGAICVTKRVHRSQFDDRCVWPIICCIYATL